jgi:hypothetical protein
MRSGELIPGRTKAFLPKAQSGGRRKEKKEVLLCVYSGLVRQMTDLQEHVYFLTPSDC